MAATQDLGLEDLPLPALLAGAMLLPKDQVTAKMLKELLTTQVLIFSAQYIAPYLSVVTVLEVFLSGSRHCKRNDCQKGDIFELKCIQIA